MPPGSNGELVITLYDQGKELISSYNPGTGKNTAQLISSATRRDSIHYLV
jgi:hypothetical protein